MTNGIVFLLFPILRRGAYADEEVRSLVRTYFSHPTCLCVIISLVKIRGNINFVDWDSVNNHSIVESNRKMNGKEEKQGVDKIVSVYG